jgi:hypothetical protein
MDNYSSPVEKSVRLKIRDWWYRKRGWGTFLEQILKHQREVERQRFRRIAFMSLPCSCGTESCLMHDVINQIDGKTE